eukprot:Pgem_evm1s18677
MRRSSIASEKSKGSGSSTKRSDGDSAADTVSLTRRLSNTFLKSFRKKSDAQEQAQVGVTSCFRIST